MNAENNTTYLAHVRQLPNGRWIEHFLEEHLLAVAVLAAEFASVFNSQDWARLSGLWHDIGKFREKFQKYIKSVSGYDAEAHIEGAPGRVDHSTAGAIHAIEELGPPGRIIAYLIAGHHAGLPDWNGEPASLFQRIEDGKQKGYRQEALQNAPTTGLFNQPCPTSSPPQDGSFALWIRMLFSCLVDADFLDTEAFMDERRKDLRAGYPALNELLSAFDQYMNDKTANATDSPVNRIRTEVLRQCCEKATLPPGLFSLTVPTGGGKTLSSTAFALNHAMHHGKQRVIYVIPYTSILEQTAEIFRKIFGDENVIEHHSNLDPDKEDSRSRLATENWDAPIIVTTNVQFFESLFAARTSRCRKLHNIVNSVVVLDEAQLLPPEFLAPILHVMQDLSQNYKVSFVLSTATQPAFSPRPKFSGLRGVQELMDDPDGLYADLKRVEAELPRDFNAPRTWESIAEELQQYDSVLCIVNSRTDCRALHALMPRDTIHLSALMCGQHRSEVIADIKQRLKDGIPTRVISTQLVEAGVDIDFPVVYRALAGLDAVAQAAGRCNREGMLPGMGKVVVFVPPKPAVPGLLRKAQQSGQEIMRLTEGDPLTRERFEAYFRHYYASLNSLDEENIIGLLDMHNRVEARRAEFSFRTAADKFQLIKGSSQKTENKAR
ncbi:CRISPR-associated endonuclease Cas3'' [Nitrosomonas europaea]|uniref:CRISPR-associated endonuclease Cas3'' n=2 Tax=Nitrosomonas TaxID=914 RepID=UPI0002E4CD2C|nr:CRISPR-associated endonuclease Cas3'' [Nitrosomonas europaea]SDW15856.1 CRISPR-associated helicase, Cas3 family [Nitrosomonas europaea]SET33994.1 CRISPR-associated helicase, Cas3 family [Nitrosomonas europaea]SJZ35023.1 CRISPR-associated helicase, Cas3 family [Nitrosomonas europaea]